MTPRRILFCHLFPHRTKLRRLRPRIPRGPEIDRTLEALPDLDKGTIRNRNGP